MQALDAGDDWPLVHTRPAGRRADGAGRAPARGRPVGLPHACRRRELWDTVMRSAYDFAEPGILFPDTINQDNNLRYCE